MNQYKLNEKEVVDLILDLNCFLHDSWNGNAEETPFFQLSSRGDTFIIEFLGIYIFGSDQDDRIHYESTDTYEPFKEYLLRKAESIINSLNEITFDSCE
jgi:hypothetical protein